jgi:Tol biopolymer transport system component/DNA-binding winged helix-turn-helix (wHTH) protein
MSDASRVAGTQIRVGEFVLDPRSGELRGNAGRQRLSAQPLHVLLALLDRPGELVTRDELRQRLWPADTYVDFEHGLNAIVKRLRDALGDSADTPRYIETVPRRGYRLVAALNHGTPASSAPIPEPTVPTPEPAASSEPRPAADPVPAGARRRYALVAASLLAALALAALVSLNYRREAQAAFVEAPRPAVDGVPTRLTFGPGLQTDATWSPDGRRIAFAWDRDGSFDIFTQGVDGGEPTRITSTPFNDTQPAWSPDGRRLVFRSEEDGGGLYTVDATGGPVRRITSGGLRAAWMPDGRHIVFSDTDFRALYRVQADGGEAPREILEGQLSGGAWSSFAVHPDGRIGVLGIHRTTRFGFYVADRDNRRLQAVDTKVALPLGWQTAFGQVHWHPAGTSLFVEAIADGVPAIWRVPVDPSTLAWRQPIRMTTALASADGAAISPDGSRLAFTRADSTIRAWLFPFDADAGGPPGGGRAISDENASIAFLALSADGSTLFFAERQPGRDDWRMLRTDLDTGQTTVISEGQAPIPVIPSRDGRSATYLVHRRDTDSTAGDLEYSVAVRDSDGKERLVGPWRKRGVFHPSVWAHQDRVLGTMQERAFTGPSPLVEWPIGSSASAGPSRVVMDAPMKQFWQGRYSPDARWVSFVVLPLGPAAGNPALELGVAPARSERATTWSRIAADHAWPDKPRWSPDGKTLYFLSPAPAGFFNVWGVRVDPTDGSQLGAPFQVTNFDSPRWHVDPDMGGSCEVGIAKGRLVLPMRSVRGSIWMIPARTS